MELNLTANRYNINTVIKLNNPSSVSFWLKSVGENFFGVHKLISGIKVEEDTLCLNFTNLLKTDLEKLGLILYILHEKDDAVGRMWHVSCLSVDDTDNKVTCSLLTIRYDFTQLETAEQACENWLSEFV